MGWECRTHPWEQDRVRAGREEANSTMFTLAFYQLPWMSQAHLHMAGLAGASMVSEHGKAQDAFGDQPKIQFGSI